jgi:CubicO group peptidase (beta-lactamase class C family)
LLRHGSAYAGILLCLAVLSCATPPAPPPPVPAEIWPTKAWPVSTPEAQGVDSSQLADALATLRARDIPVHSLLVERNGYVILDAYFYPYSDHEPHDVASITKSVTSMLVGVAIAEHAPLDLNAPITSLLPGEEIADPVKARITLAELLSMTSGLDCSPDAGGRSLLAQMETSPHWASYMLDRPIAANPGSKFDYCAGNMHIVSAVLTRATGASALELSQQKLFEPLGITDVTWPADPDGISHGFADMRLKPRDLAKLGYLWLHHGRWENQQVVPLDYLKNALTPHADVEPGIQYGFGMWLYPGHVPYDFEANGRGGQRITVIPSLNAVVVVTGGGMDANVVMPLIAGAFKSNDALAANPTAEARLAQVSAQIAAPPPSTPCTAPPIWSTALAGKTWLLAPNPMGVQSLQISFPNSNVASLQFGFADGTSEVHPIGLDGAPRLSPNRASGLDVAVSGRWTADAFEIDYDEVARINAYRLVLKPQSSGLNIRITERSGLADTTITAQAAPAIQEAAGVTSRSSGSSSPMQSAGEVSSGAQALRGGGDQTQGR